jgi:hypothetical protein
MCGPGAISWKAEQERDAPDPLPTERVHYWTLPSIGIALLRNFGQIDIIDLEVVLSLHKTHTLAENERYTIEPTWSAAGFRGGWWQDNRPPKHTIEVSFEAEEVSSFTREAAKVRRANKRCEEERRLD